MTKTELNKRIKRAWTMVLRSAERGDKEAMSQWIQTYRQLKEQRQQA